MKNKEETNKPEQRAIKIKEMGEINISEMKKNRKLEENPENRCGKMREPL